MIKLSGSETKWSDLLARTGVLILYISILRFDFGTEKPTGTFEKPATDLKRVWKIIFFGLK